MKQWLSGPLRMTNHTKTGPCGQSRVGRRVKWAWFLLLVLPGLAACAGRPAEPPSLELKSPEDGVQVALGERVLVQSLAQDDQAVVKTELWVDGRLYEVEHADQDVEKTTLDAIHIWEASTLGSHTLLVRAYDAQGQASQSVGVQVQVVSLPPTPTLAPTVAATVAVDPSCEPSARFVEDVTVPDDTLYNGGVNFRKTWRMRNDGECTWETGTTWTFIEGDLLGANSPVEVELAEPGRIVDVSVDMVAPTSPGAYRSYWRLQRPDGEYFGDQAYVRIIVP